jgi:hypothetical protein
MRQLELAQSASCNDDPVLADLTPDSAARSDSSTSAGRTSTMSMSLEWSASLRANEPKMIKPDVALAPFVNDLLNAERAVAGVEGSALDINRQVTTPGGGVDAALPRSAETSWLPAGDSAWNFKSSDRSLRSANRSC